MTTSLRDQAPQRKLKPVRVLNIFFRTLHIAVTGVLMGGHVFNVTTSQLKGWLYAAILTGAILIAIETYPRWWWFCQGRGVATIVKMLLLCMIPWLWEDRVLILMVVIVIASVGSHMPARFRYYSFLHGRVLHDPRDKEPEPVS
jgi:hypothetical protein